MTKLQFLSFSLPFGLFCEVLDKGTPKIAKLSGVYDNGDCVFYDTIESDKGFSSVKPILRPLCDLTREIDGKIGIVELAKISEPNEQWVYDSYRNRAVVIGRGYKWFLFNKTSFYAGISSWSAQNVHNQPQLFEYLFKNHYDIAGLIENGEAIDVNTITNFKYQ